MANRTPPSQWGNLFNFAGGGLVHIELYALLSMSQLNPTLFEAIASFLSLYGTHAARPSAADVPLNALYACTTHQVVYQNQAGSWATITGAGGGGSGTLGGAAVLQTSAQSISNGVDTAVEYDSELYDTDGYFDAGGDPTIYTVPDDGVFLLTSYAGVNFAAASGQLQLSLLHNGSFLSAYSVESYTGNSIARTISTIYPAAATDTFQTSIYQNSGSSLNLLGNGTTYGPYFTIERLR